MVLVYMVPEYQPRVHDEGGEEPGKKQTSLSMPESE